MQKSGCYLKSEAEEVRHHTREERKHDDPGDVVQQRAHGKAVQLERTFDFLTEQTKLMDHFSFYNKHNTLMSSNWHPDTSNVAAGIKIVIIVSHGSIRGFNK